jgi:putative intracellular protease/amidase
MAKHTLHGLKVAILVTDGFEEVELLEPRRALDEAGADTCVVSPKPDRVRRTGPGRRQTTGATCLARDSGLTGSARGGEQPPSDRCRSLTRGPGGIP